MKTRFHERTAYSLSSEPVPSCFLTLDEHFDQYFSRPEDAFIHRSVLLAESVCGRMADIEMYAFLFQDVRTRHTIDKREDDKAAVLTRSFMLGYIAACRALLDSGSATLSILYDLPLGYGERSFGNGDFWHQLVISFPAVHRRYHPLRLFFNEVMRWNAETVLRVPPLAVLHHHYGPYPSREAQLKVIDGSDTDLDRVAIEPFQVEWIDPLLLHQRWKVRLLTLCEKLCQDIQQNT